MQNLGNIKIALDGSVQSQGIKVSVRNWLDMGSEEWVATPDEVKSAAYQAALVCGWKDEGLISFMVSEFGPRVDEFAAKFTLETLKELVAKFPLEQEQVYEVKKEVPVFKKRNDDNTYVLG